MRIFLPERREGKAEHFSAVAAGLLKRTRLWIRHYNRKDDRETEREVSPQRLVHYRDNWYLDAYCHLREDLRSFAVDAIREARLLDERAKEVAASELDEYLGSGYGIFAGRKVQWATLKFMPEAARWVSAQSWHPKQRSRVEKDGSYVLGPLRRGSRAGDGDPQVRSGRGGAEPRPAAQARARCARAAAKRYAD